MSHRSPDLRRPVPTGSTTHPNLHIRDAKDAHVVLEAVRLNILPLITRRLSPAERDQLGSGNVFVWEEAEFKGGLERWTDGRRWSQSRMRGDYLFYEEKVETTQEERDVKAARRARRALDPASVPPLPTRRQDRPSKPDGLTKQTYSTQVYFPGQTAPKKWHIVAYFAGNDYTRLPVIDNYDYLRTIRVPDGIFVSSKGPYRQNDASQCDTDDEDPIYSITTSNSQYSAPSRTFSPPPSSSSYQYSGSSHSRAHQHPSRTPLPRLSTVVPMNGSSVTASPQYHDPNRGHQPPGGAQNGHTYMPLSAEDRRVLNAFRVVL